MGHGRTSRDRAVEYHALLLTAAAGMSLLAVSNSFVIAFVALELFSIALYVLVAIDTDALPGAGGRPQVPDRGLGGRGLPALRRRR